MSKSVRRVERAAAELALPIAIKRMPESTRTTADAAMACGCSVAQIAKSMIFQGTASSRLKLIIVSGKHELVLHKATDRFGEALTRADPTRVREETGFAIGGVAPIGHLTPIQTWIDSELMQLESIWVAAGAPDSVFSVEPHRLAEVTAATIFVNRA